MPLREIIYTLLSFGLGIRYQKKLNSSAEIRKVIVFKPDHIGDLILALPLFENLRCHLPQAKIVVIVNSSAKRVLESNPYVDDLIEYDAKLFARLKPASGLRKSFSLLRQLLREDFDLIVDLRATPLSLAFALLSGAKYRFDRASRRVEGRLSGSLAEHEVEINLDVIENGGIRIDVKQPRFITNDSDKKWTKNLFESLKLKDDDFLVAIHAGAPKPEKRWPIERFAHLAQTLHSKYRAQFLIVGGKDEMEISDQLVNLIPNFASNLAGKTDFGQLASVIERCDLFIGNDSGPMHLAAAVNTKTVGLLSPVTLHRFRPYGENAISIRGAPNCPPCRSKASCKVSPIGCMEQIQVETVMRILDQIDSNAAQML